MGKRTAKTVPKRAFIKFDVGLGKKKKDTNTRPKITANRITVIPGFLSQGVKVATDKKEEAEKRRNENILKEDLNSLFLGNYENNSLRRSVRISKKNAVNYAEFSCKKRKYSKQKKSIDSKSLEPNTYTIPEYTYTPLCKIEEEQRSSQSLFKKIISSQPLSNGIYFLKSFFTNKDLSDSEDFNKKVLDKIKVNFKKDIENTVRNRIFEEIDRVNSILSGKFDPSTMDNIRQMIKGHMDDVEHQVPEFLFTPNDWQFATPPSQKVNLTFYEESAIQPAVLCNDGTGRNIYQLKKEINANLINHINPNSIEVDNRYMEQIAEFDKENRPLRTFNPNQTKSTDARSDDFDFKPKFFNKYLMEHLMTVKMRPKKTVKRLTFAESLTRVFESTKPSASTTYDPLAMETSEVDFTYVNCSKDGEMSESPRSRMKRAPRVDIFSCLDNCKELYNSSSENMDY